MDFVPHSSHTHGRRPKKVLAKILASLSLGNSNFVNDMKRPCAVFRWQSLPCNVACSSGQELNWNLSFCILFSKVLGILVSLCEALRELPGSDFVAQSGSQMSSKIYTCLESSTTRLFPFLSVFMWWLFAHKLERPKTQQHLHSLFKIAWPEKVQDCTTCFHAVTVPRLSSRVQARLPGVCALREALGESWRADAKLVTRKDIKRCFLNSAWSTFK